MDLSDATKYVLYRIQMLEPDLATKIVGCILIEDRGERDMIRLAYASDKLLENIVHKTKLQLGFLSLSTPISPPLADASVNYTPFDDYRFQNQADHLRGTRGFPVKICHYFNKGFCKHGSSCRYHHATEDHHAFSPDSLEKLEIEISELLKLKRGNPLSIASLPMLYYENYGKTLQAEGYLTESQRHGRAGYSLTKLLARLKGIRLIDRIGEAKSCYSAILRRPHGQHSVILAEDASKYNSLDNQSERNDPGPIVNGSRQIYLTFPADSTFTEEDVSNYFSSFGAVEDVRIPCQQKRMFGFVTFVNVNTAKTALVKGNPHFVCGSRVLAKPYREKSKLLDRKYMEKNDHAYYGGNHFDMEPDFSSRRCAPPRFLRRQLMEKEQALEMEMRRLSELRLACKFLHNRQYTDYSVEDLNPSQEDLGYLVGVMNNNSGSDDTSTHSQGINLPESPFAPAIGGSAISTVL